MGESAHPPSPVPAAAPRAVAADDGTPLHTVVVVVSAGADPAADRTPLVEAETPTLDHVARRGRVGLLHNHGSSPWEGFLSILGRAEGPRLGVAAALAAGIDVPAGQAAYRADFVTADETGLRDVTGGGIDDPEAQVLLEALAAAAREAGEEILIGRLPGPRNLALLPEPSEFAPTPEEAVGQTVATLLAPGGRLARLYTLARSALGAHDVNAVRVDLGENPANGLWFHGGGVPGPAASSASWWGDAPALLLGNDPALVGLARWAGWPAAVTAGADDELAALALAALAEHPVIVVRTQTARRAAGTGDPVAKRDALSAIDARLLAPLHSALEERGPFRLLVAFDDVLETATHRRAGGALPFAALGHAAEGQHERGFTEAVCARSGLHVDPSGLADVFGAA